MNENIANKKKEIISTPEISPSTSNTSTIPTYNVNNNINLRQKKRKIVVLGKFGVGKKNKKN